MRPLPACVELSLSLVFIMLLNNSAAQFPQDPGKSEDELEKERAEMSANITVILNKLVDPHGERNYDKRLRPNYGGLPVSVGITIHVSSISAVSEVAMDYTIDMYLRQTWEDPRLIFDGISGDLTIGVQYMKSIWVPDTFFPNEKKSFFHDATTHNSFLRITSKGHVLTSQRLTVTATCPMELHLFPLDSQACTLEIESYGYSTRDIKYLWARGHDSVSKTDFKLPQFKLSGFHITEKQAALSTGNYSRLACTFRFSRSLGFYFIQIYLPSQLIVIISWVSFWLSRDASPARVALGVTTVLTMTTLMTTTNSSMPKVSYIKSIDVYLITCFFMVFASLIEYATVGYLNKKLRMRKETKIKGPSTGTVMMPNGFPPMGGGGGGPRSFNTGTMNYQPVFGSVSAQLPQGSPVHKTKSGYRKLPTQTYQMTPSHTSYEPPDYDCICDLSGRGAPESRITIARPTRRHRRSMAVNPSSIDKYSRLLFPMFFIIFNAVYWSVYYFISYQKEAELAEH